MAGNLDITALPTQLVWNPQTNAAVDLGKVALELRGVIEHMMEDDIIAERESFGYALARQMPFWSGDLNDPQRLISLVVYWGPEGLRYAANACRKIRAAAREEMDTESIRINHPNRFSDIVASVDDEGNFPWGDFPYDGAAYVEVQGQTLLGAVSAYPKEQDPMVARLVTNHIGLAMFESDRMLSEEQIVTA
jgi:hypothetical protein